MKAVRPDELTHLAHELSDEERRQLIDHLDEHLDAIMHDDNVPYPVKLGVELTIRVLGGQLLPDGRYY